MAFGAFIIGDEIMVGKRQDRHLPFVIEALKQRGLRLEWAEYHGDDPRRLTEALTASVARGDVVFSFGGIGATPDDQTRQSAADACGVALALHPGAEQAIHAKFGDEANAQRLRMGEFPVGSEIIPNPYNGIPGFMIAEHHFVPGFPQMSWPMVEWVLDTRYGHLVDRDRWAEMSLVVRGVGETFLIPIMDEVNRTHAGVKSFSLPSISLDPDERIVELGVRGDPDQVAAAHATMRAMLDAAGFSFDVTQH